MGNTKIAPETRTIASIRKHVVTESYSVPERIRIFKSTPDRFEEDDALFDQRIAAWQKALAKKNIEDMADRVETLGITIDDLPLILGRLTPDEKEVVPDWWVICEDVLTEQIHSEDDCERDTFLSNEDKELIPFEDVLAPWIRVATNHLQQRFPEHVAKLDPTILRKEQRGLLENLAIATRTIMLKNFELFKINMYDTNDLFLGLVVPKPPNDAYVKFTTEILEDRWHSYILKFPALARLMATRVQFWIRSLGDFLERLESDKPELERIFSPESPLGQLTDGGRGISDSHNGGNAVVICTFENGCKIVYKPRPMSIDAAWDKFLEWFNDRFQNLDPPARLQISDRGSYGWMAFAKSAPCADLEEVGQYYKRMGQLLCLVHMLHGNDFHLENIVAAGPFPVAVDLETVTVPEYVPSVPEGGVGLSPALVLSQRSVLRTLLLPMAMGPGQGPAQNIGAVGLDAEGPGGAPVRRTLKGINTDFMKWVEAKGEDDNETTHSETDPAQSLVKLADGTKVVPQDHRSDLIEGYCETYDVIQESRDEFISHDGALSFFENGLTRFLNRATNVYFRLLNETYSDNAMQNGSDQWIAADRLALMFTTDVDADPITFSYILEMEHEALFRGDIPCFYAYGASHSISTIDIETEQIIEDKRDSLTTPALTAAREQIAGMSSEDRDRQVDFIESSYLTALITLNNTMHTPTHDEKHTPRTMDEESDEGLANFARESLEDLLSCAYRNDQGLLDWLDLSMDPSRGVTVVSPMDAGLYSGRGGFSLLFQSGYRRFGDRRYLDAAIGSVTLERDLVDRNLAGVVAPDGMLGHGGMALSWWELGAHEGCGIWRTRTRKLIDKIDSIAINRDSAFDVIGGSAGTILILSRIFQQEKIPEVKQVIDKLAQHLLRHANNDHGGPAWKSSLDTNQKLSLCGFAHGIAGVALALLHAWRVTGNKEFRDTARRAIACEHALRSDEHGIWPDFRIADGLELQKSTTATKAWCLGTSSIALARAAGLEIDDDPIARDDLELCLSKMNDTVNGVTRPHLCCGTTGYGEIKRTIGLRTSQQSECDAGISIIKQAICHQKKGDLTEGCFGLGLMQGNVGLAWSALTAEGKTPDQLDILLLGS